MGDDPAESHQARRYEMLDVAEGGNGRETSKFPTDDADGMDERKLVGIIVCLECGFMHQATDREVRHHESEKLLANQIRGPAS